MSVGQLVGKVKKPGFQVGSDGCSSPKEVPQWSKTGFLSPTK